MKRFKPRYRYVSKKRQTIEKIAMVGCVAVFIVCAWLLIDYYGQKTAHDRQNQALEEMYLASDDVQPEEQEKEEEATPAPVQETTPAPVSANADPARQSSYPDNPNKTVSSRFAELRQTYPDIVGRLKIDGVISEYVVQRDNEYYLRRDISGKTNSNGTIFMDEDVNLQVPPPVITLYGHNMKSGAMFGFMKSYESADYYKAHPFIVFDTLYEECDWVILAQCVLSLNKDSLKYVDLYALMYGNATARLTQVQRVAELSSFSVPLDVCASDRLILLVTCTDSNNDVRRVLLGRKIRSDETRQQIKEIVAKAQ